MKTLYLIGGTMGVGKTAVGRKMNELLRNSVFLDGDWCWNADPFQVTDETKAMVMDNISHLLNNFIHCSTYENIVFSWVLHRQDMIDDLLGRLDTRNCTVKVFSLVCDEKTLRERLQKDIVSGIRTADVINRSLARLPLYHKLNSIKVETTSKSVETIAKEILANK